MSKKKKTKLEKTCDDLRKRVAREDSFNEIFKEIEAEVEFTNPELVKLLFGPIVINLCLLIFVGFLLVSTHNPFEVGIGILLFYWLRGRLNSVILQNHGILTTGPSVDIALWFYMSMERCCQAQLMAEAAGTPVIIPHETAIKTRDFIANDIAAWASYQPAYDMIIKREPDLLD